MANPFEVPTSKYSVLVNDEGQHSLWPLSADVPAGWTAAYGPADREGCLAWAAEHWTDLRPYSLAGHPTEVS